MSSVDEVTKVLVDSEIDGFFLTSTTIAIKFSCSTQIKFGTSNEFWLYFDCNAQIFTKTDKSVLDYFSQEGLFLVELNSLITSQITGARFSNGKLILDLNSSEKQLIVLEDEADPSEVIWSIYPTFEFNYGEWVYAYIRDRGIVVNNRL